MDRLTAVFVEGMGAAAATSGVLTQLQGRIFGLLYLSPTPVSLDELTDELQQSKSNVSVNVRGLIDWQLVRQLRVPGSRKDHYEAATDFWRVMQEIMERRFRWNLRQVVAAAEETEREVEASRPKGTDAVAQAGFIAERLAALREFFAAVDVGLGGFTRGESFVPQPLQRVFVTVPVEDRASRAAQRRSGRERR
jgi:DNA-binding transcriptional regulator GbsR (MarR family)